MSSKPSSRPANHATILRNWASLGASLRSTHIPAASTWNALRQLIELTRLKLAGDREQLLSLLHQARALLAPLEDPFDMDLGLHRWLDSEREEAYSDWLEWVLAQTDGPPQLLKLLDLDVETDTIRDCGDIEIERECCIPHGHEDREGRLDLVVRLGHQLIIVIEVKKGDADAADTIKHDGYSRWLEKQPHLHRRALLLAVSATEEVYRGFQFLSWSTLCINMRQMAVELCTKPRVATGAMVLAFVAAVEQNLLGFSAQRVKDICDGRALMFNAAVVDHLERFVKQMEV
jgi:hypothetical protein